MARSLTEGLDTPKAPAKKSGKAGDTSKLIFAVVLLGIAGLVFAWTQGWIFAPTDKGVQMTAEEQAAQMQEFQAQQKATEEKVKKGEAKIGGSS